MGAAARAAVLVALSAGCGDWRDAPDFEWHGENVTVYGYGYTEANVCGGSFSELDGHIAMIERDLGIEDGPIYTYRWLSMGRLAAIDEPPCGSHVACSANGEAVSLWLPHIHEAVHSIIYHETQCPRLLDEGLAMYYEWGDAHGGDPPSWEETTLPALLEHGIGEDTHGPRVGAAMRLTSFLAEVYGPSSVLELCGELPTLEPSLAAWEVAVGKVYGISLDELVAEYEAHPRCTYSQMRAKLWGCQRSPDVLLAHPGERIIIESSCADPNATNGLGGPGDAVLRRLVQVPWDMLVEVDASSPGDRQGPEATYVITECAPCSDDPSVHADSHHANVDDRHVLRAGRHEVSVFFDRRDRVRLSLEVIALYE